MSTPVENPYLDAVRAITPESDAARDEMISTYGFAIPTEEAIEAIARCSPDGVVEIGAGTGYWASLLHGRGIDVIAFDPEPAPSPQSTWFAGVEPWHPLERGGHEVAGEHPRRTLLIVWPTKNETWATAAVQRYHEAGGRCVVFVGEGPGGRTGDTTFHAVMGAVSGCAQCDYGAPNQPCTCGIEALWHRMETIALPHWPGFSDDLHVYERAVSPVSGRRKWNGRRGWRGRRR